MFNWYVGTSAGAVTAMLLACGYSVEELKAILEAKNFNDFKDANLPRALFNLVFKGGMYEGHSFTQWMENLLSKKLEKPHAVELRDIPNRVTVYASRRELDALVFDRDDHIKGRQSVRAAYVTRCSMAIPFFFVPERSQGLNVFDGGSQNNYPVERLLRDNPGTEFIGLYLGDETYQGAKKVSVFTELLSIWTEANDYVALRNHNDRTIVIDPSPISTLDFRLSNNEKEFLLDAGRYAAEHFLFKQNLGKKTEGELIEQKKQLEINRAKLIRQRKRSKLLRLLFVILTLACMSVALIFWRENSKVELEAGTRKEVGKTTEINNDKDGQKNHTQPSVALKINVINDNNLPVESGTVHVVTNKSSLDTALLKGYATFFLTPADTLSKISIVVRSSQFMEHNETFQFRKEVKILLRPKSQRKYVQDLDGNRYQEVPIDSQANEIENVTLDGFNKIDQLNAYFGFNGIRIKFFKVKGCPDEVVALKPYYISEPITYKILDTYCDSNRCLTKHYFSNLEEPIDSMYVVDYVNLANALKLKIPKEEEIVNAKKCTNCLDESSHILFFNYLLSAPGSLDIETLVSKPAELSRKYNGAVGESYMRGKKTIRFVYYE